MNAQTHRCDATTPYYQDYLIVTKSLSCAVCGGQRVASSDSPFARTVKRDVCKYLQQGMSRAEVVERIEQGYGDGLQVAHTGTPALWPMLGVLAVLAVIGGLAVRTLIKGQPEG